MGVQLVAQDTTVQQDQEAVQFAHLVNPVNQPLPVIVAQGPTARKEMECAAIVLEAITAAVLVLLLAQCVLQECLVPPALVSLVLLVLMALRERWDVGHVLQVTSVSQGPVIVQHVLLAKTAAVQRDLPLTVRPVSTVWKKMQAAPTVPQVSNTHYIVSCMQVEGCCA